MDVERIKLESTWKSVLLPEFSKPYMQNLRAFLQSELEARKKIYPKAQEYFAAFHYTPLDQVKVVILGQDPYHGPNQAHGLCFSVRPGVDIPPSLQNIFKELKKDLNFSAPEHGCLVSWAKQGVLLLNASLSVRAGEAGSHQKRGWEEFTDSCVSYLNQHCENLVFMLWGSFAINKGEKIDVQRHLVLKAPHPSPLSAHRGFFGCKHFSQANEYLAEHHLDPIDWSLPTRAEVEAMLL